MASDSGTAPAAAPPAASTFGAELRLAGYAEAVEESRVAAYAQAIETAALNELSALQQLAALAQWPQPYAAPAPRAAVAAAPRPRTEPWTDATFSAAVLDLLNARRASAGLAPVRADGRIAQAASIYALRMTTLDAFGHSVDGSTLTSRLAAAGFVEQVPLGEVIGWSSGAPSPSAFVQMWMDSPAHREQILSGTYRLAGAGCAFDGDAVRCVVALAG